MVRIDKNVTFEDARIVFRNFAGNTSMYNTDGKRNFAVVIQGDALAEQMRNDGWNVKSRAPREGYEEDGLFHTLEVALGDPTKTNSRPPKVVFVGSRGLTELPPELWGLADTADILNVDLIIRPYNWVMREGTAQETRGVKAYLQSIYIKLREDDLDMKYKDVPLADGRPTEDPGDPGERRDVRFED